MYCSACGSKICDEAKFCCQCGVRIKEEESTDKKVKLNNNCNMCGGPLKKADKNRYMCDYCGSEYTVNDDNEVLESKLTEKELLDIFYKAAQFEIGNNPREELMCLLDVKEKASDNVLYLVKLGRAYRRNNMYPKAMECYEKAVSLNPEFANAYTNMCTVYTALGMLPKAEECARKAIDLMNKNRIDYTNDDYSVAYANCALVLGKQGKMDYAKVMLEIAEKNGYKNGDKLRQQIGLKKGFFRK